MDIQYDAVGRRTLLTLPNQVSTEYQYDPASRLTALIYRNALGPLGDLTYQYDAAGNRIAVGGTFARTLLPDSVPSATYDPANRQLQFGDKLMTFDGNGNLASMMAGGGTTTYTWDSRNRVTSISDPSLGASFGYDALGRRAAKMINGQSITFLYDGRDIIQEARSTGFVGYLRTLTIDEALMRGDTSGTLGYLADALRSTVGLADTTGALPTTYTYAPFGETGDNGSASSNSFQFTGRENDGTGLYYFRGRYYHPLLQRFISEDPIGFLGSDINYFAYVWNSPTGFVDPAGFWGFGIVGGGTIAGGLGSLGAAATGSAGGGVFTGGTEGSNVGGLASGGGIRRRTRVRPKLPFG